MIEGYRIVVVYFYLNKYKGGNGLRGKQHFSTFKVYLRFYLWNLDDIVYGYQFYTTIVRLSKQLHVEMSPALLLLFISCFTLATGEEGCLDWNCVRRSQSASESLHYPQVRHPLSPPQQVRRPSPPQISTPQHPVREIPVINIYYRIPPQAVFPRTPSSTTPTTTTTASSLAKKRANFPLLPFAAIVGLLLCILAVACKWIITKFTQRNVKVEKTPEFRVSYINDDQIKLVGLGPSIEERMNSYLVDEEENSEEFQARLSRFLKPSLEPTEWSPTDKPNNAKVFSNHRVIQFLFLNK